MKEAVGRAHEAVIWRSIIWGCLAWIAYGLVEVILSASAQMWRAPEVVIPGWQWRLIAMLMGAYAAMGIVTGAMAGVLLKVIRRDRMPGTTRTAATLTIALAFFANLIVAADFRGPELVGLAVSFLLVMSLSGALMSDWFKRILLLASPWTASLLLLGAPWSVHEALNSEASRFVRVLSPEFVLVAIIIFATLGNRICRDRPATILGQAALVSAISATFVAVTLMTSGIDIPAADMGQRGVPTSTAKPNIVLISMDTARADHTSLYGYDRDTTPHLREWSASATLYTRAIATSDFTLPTHASMFTGMYPEWHGAFNDGTNVQALPLNRLTLAEVLESHGYWTGESAANHVYLAGWTGLTRGSRFAKNERPLALKPRSFHLRRVVQRLLSLVVDMTTLDRLSLAAEDVGARGTFLLYRAKTSGSPFFLFLNYMDAHGPYRPGPPFDTRFSDKDPRFTRPVEQDRWVTLERKPLSGSERAFTISQYDGAVAAEDENIDLLINKLKELGLYDNTLIIVTSDHGEAFGERNLLQHGQGVVYDDLVHVPLIVKYPGQQAGRRSDELISQVDLMPIALMLAGIPAPPGVQGSTFLELGSHPNRVVYSSATGLSAFARGDRRFKGTRRAIFSGSLKLITWTQGPPELYDLASDPEEQRNLYSPSNTQARELSQRLDAWVATVPQRTSPSKLDPVTRERLKSLGYVQ
jgi:arylsulfatase A-like enzyme